MRALAEYLNAYVEQQFRTVLTRNVDTYVRPVLVGPPDAAVREMFSLLTGAGQHDWQLNVGPNTCDVVVLLVDSSPPAPTGAVSSCGCCWDYAISVRNSYPRALILATRASWDNRPESLANTTETIGELGVTSRTSDDPLQAHLVTAVSSRLGLDKSSVKELLGLVRRESAKLEPSARDAMTWEVLENLLSSLPGTAPADAACRATGLPVIGQASMRFTDAYRVLSDLGTFVGATGLHDAIDQMKATAAAQQHGIGASLDSLCAHLSASLFSPTLLQNAPSRYYRVASPVPVWYNALTATALSDVLAELDQGPRQDRLVLACINGLPGASPIRKGAFVTATTAELRASTAAGTQPPALTFTRKVDRAVPGIIPTLPADPLRATDVVTTTHRKPIKYKVEAPNYRPGTVDVIVVEQFECRGLVVTRDAERNGIPVYASRGGTWTQELALSRGGRRTCSCFTPAPSPR